MFVFNHLHQAIGSVLTSTAVICSAESWRWADFTGYKRAAVGIGMAIGGTLGGFAGYYGKRWDELLMRLAKPSSPSPAFCWHFWP